MEPTPRGHTLHLNKSQHTFSVAAFVASLHWFSRAGCNSASPSTPKRQPDHLRDHTYRFTTELISIKRASFRKSPFLSILHRKLYFLPSDAKISNFFGFSLEDMISMLVSIRNMRGGSRANPAVCGDKNRAFSPLCVGKTGVNELNNGRMIRVEDKGRSTPKESCREEWLEEPQRSCRRQTHRECLDVLCRNVLGTPNEILHQQEDDYTYTRNPMPTYLEKRRCCFHHDFQPVIAPADFFDDFLSSCAATCVWIQQSEKENAFS